MGIVPTIVIFCTDKLLFRWHTRKAGFHCAQEHLKTGEVSQTQENNTIDKSGKSTKPKISKKALCGIGVGVGGAIVGIVAAPLVLSAAGFTAGGVAAGSIAAWAQSVIYGGATTGIFSLLQSAGAAGLGVAGNAVAGAVGAAAGAGLGVAGNAAAEKIKDATAQSSETEANDKSKPKPN